MVCCDKVQLSDTGRSVGLGRCQTVTVDRGNSLFDLAAAASAAAENLPGTAAGAVTRETVLRPRGIGT